MDVAAQIKEQHKGNMEDKHNLSKCLKESTTQGRADQWCHIELNIAWLVQ